MTPDNHNHFCIYCGAKLVPDQHFCSQCGKEVYHDPTEETITAPSKYKSEIDKIIKAIKIGINFFILYITTTI